MHDGLALPHRTVRHQIDEAIDLILHLSSARVVSESRTGLTFTSIGTLDQDRGKESEDAKSLPLREIGWKPL